MDSNGFVLVYMAPMLIIIGLFCGRSCLGCVFGGPRLVSYLVILILLDIHARGLVVSFLAQPCLLSRTLLRIII